MPNLREKRTTPPPWSACSWVTRMASLAAGSRSSRARRRTVSVALKPQSSRTRERPASTTSALPSLPLPNEAKRMAEGAGGRKPIAGDAQQPQDTERAGPALRRACPLPDGTSLQLIVEQREYAIGRVRLLPRAVLVEHADFRAGTFRLHQDAVLFLALHLRAAAPEFQLGQPARFLSRLEVGVGINVAHEIQPFRAVAVLDREAHAIQREADTPPGTVELVVQRQQAAVGAAIEFCLRLDLGRRPLGLGPFALDAETHHDPAQHFRLEIGIGRTRLPAQLVLRFIDVHLFHAAVADIDFSGTGLRAALEPGAELVALGGRIQAVQRTPQYAANAA